MERQRQKHQNPTSQTPEDELKEDLIKIFDDYGRDQQFEPDFVKNIRSRLECDLKTIKDYHLIKYYLEDIIETNGLKEDTKLNSLLKAKLTEYEALCSTLADSEIKAKTVTLSKEPYSQDSHSKIPHNQLISGKNHKDQKYTNLARAKDEIKKKYYSIPFSEIEAWVGNNYKGLPKAFAWHDNQEIYLDNSIRNELETEVKLAFKKAKNIHDDRKEFNIVLEKGGSDKFVISKNPELITKTIYSDDELIKIKRTGVLQEYFFRNGLIKELYYLDAPIVYIDSELKQFYQTKIDQDSQIIKNIKDKDFYLINLTVSGKAEAIICDKNKQTIYASTAQKESKLFAEVLERELQYKVENIDAVIHDGNCDNYSYLFMLEMLIEREEFSHKRTVKNIATKVKSMSKSEILAEVLSTKLAFLESEKNQNIANVASQNQVFGNSTAPDIGQSTQTYSINQQPSPKTSQSFANVAPQNQVFGTPVHDVGQFLNFNNNQNLFSHSPQLTNHQQSHNSATLNSQDSPRYPNMKDVNAKVAEIERKYQNALQYQNQVLIDSKNQVIEAKDISVSINEVGAKRPSNITEAKKATPVDKKRTACCTVF
jgi:hypothetical protein